MTTIIAIALGLAAAYAGGYWLMILYWAISKQMLESEYADLNEQAFKLGLCSILAMGFLGIMLK